MTDEPVIYVPQYTLIRQQQQQQRTEKGIVREHCKYITLHYILSLVISFFFFHEGF